MQAPERLIPAFTSTSGPVIKKSRESIRETVLVSRPERTGLLEDAIVVEVIEPRDKSVDVIVYKQ